MAKFCKSSTFLFQPHCGTRSMAVNLIMWQLTGQSKRFGIISSNPPQRKPDVLYGFQKKTEHISQASIKLQMNSLIKWVSRQKGSNIPKKNSRLLLSFGQKSCAAAVWELLWWWWIKDYHKNSCDFTVKTVNEIKYCYFHESP